MSDTDVPMTDDYVTEAADYIPSAKATPPRCFNPLDAPSLEQAVSPLESYDGQGAHSFSILSTWLMLIEPRIFQTQFLRHPQFAVFALVFHLFLRIS